MLYVSRFDEIAPFSFSYFLIRFLILYATCFLNMINERHIFFYTKYVSHFFCKVCIVCFSILFLFCKYDIFHIMSSYFEYTVTLFLKLYSIFSCGY